MGGAGEGGGRRQWIPITGAEAVEEMPSKDTDQTASAQADPRLRSAPNIQMYIFSNRIYMLSLNYVSILFGPSCFAV